MSADGFAPAPAAQAPGARYPRSALLGALRVMGRAARPAILAILATTAVQAVLMYVNAQSGPSAAFLASFAASALVTLGLYAVLTASALASVDGPAGARLVVARVREHLGTFVAWTLVQWLAVLAVSVVQPWLIAVVAALTPYLPLAAMDGRRDALAVNLRAIRQRPGRWAITTLVLLMLGLLLFGLSVANTLFVKGTPAAVLFWLTTGVVAWWVLTAWALLLRGCPAGARRPPPDPDRP